MSTVVYLGSLAMLDQVPGGGPWRVGTVTVDGKLKWAYINVITLKGYIVGPVQLRGKSWYDAAVRRAVRRNDAARLRESKRK